MCLRFLWYLYYRIWIKGIIRKDFIRWGWGTDSIMMCKLIMGCLIYVILWYCIFRFRIFWLILFLIWLFMPRSRIKLCFLALNLRRILCVFLILFLKIMCIWISWSMKIYLDAFSWFFVLGLIFFGGMALKM